MAAHAFDIVGQRFGQWVVLVRVESTKSRQHRFLCQCDCGVQGVVQSADLRSGRSQSCGHSHQQAKRGQRTAAYRVWGDMRQRCDNPKHKKYPDYGGRGISYCDRWNSFESFVSDMGHPPPGLSLDRIDNDGNYEPDNCRWADIVTQNNNQRLRKNSVLVEYNGKIQSVYRWEMEFGLGKEVLRWRIRNGWPIEMALLTPPARRAK